MRADTTVVHVKASLTCQSAERRYHSVQLVTLWSECPGGARCSDWEQQMQHGSHSGHGQTFEAVKHIPFPTGNHSLSLQVNNCLPTKNYNFKKMELGLIIICE